MSNSTGLRVVIPVVISCASFFWGAAHGADIKAWGGNFYGESNAPAGSDYISIGAGTYHSVALRGDGTIVAWGDNYYAQCAVPTGSDFAAVTAGAWHGVALRNDGSLVAWGRNNYNQCRVPAGYDYAAVAAGCFHSLALTVDGYVRAWGLNTSGQCNAPSEDGFVSVAAGAFHGLALAPDGSIVAWGQNTYGQCDVPAEGGFVAVAGGGYHSLALAADGTLRAWGRNDYGQCNVPAGNDYVAIACGERFSLALTAAGTVFAWGRNDYGQSSVPVQERFSSIAAGWYHCLGLVAEAEENHVPVAQDQALATEEDTPLSCLLNAVDEDGDALEYVLVAGPAHGVLTGEMPCPVYEPDPNFWGVDSFTFAAFDAVSQSNTATVQITVTAVNDPPTAVATVNGKASVTLVEEAWSGTVVRLDAGASNDPDDLQLSYEWDFTSDGAADAFTPAVDVGYRLGGPYEATVRVADAAGAWSTASVETTIAPGDAARQLDILEDMIRDCAASGEVAAQIQSSLLAKLDAAGAALARNKPNSLRTAVNNLEALVRQIDAQSGKKIDAQAAAAMVERLERLVAELM